MSKSGRQAIILTKEGKFECVRLPNKQEVHIGEEIYIMRRFSANVRRFLVTRIGKK